MTPSRKRVSYLIPPSSHPVPKLRLPANGPGPASGSLGRAGPLLVPVSGSDNQTGDAAAAGNGKSPVPRHRLGVTSLALDTSTMLEGKSSPEGILYTGGRDGIVMAWDLGMGMVKRKRKSGGSRQDHPLAELARNRWEYITGWDDELEFPDDEDDSGIAGRGASGGSGSGSGGGGDGHERITSDGDILGDVSHSATLRRKHMLKELGTTPYERQWELLDLAAGGGTFRQCAQAHEDWVNDVLLCNYNQTLVSASSDGTIKAWNPHSVPSPSSSPSIIGLHSDYVRCITYSRGQGWVASGSFDRTIKLWDLSYAQSRSHGTSHRAKPEPLTTLTLSSDHHNHNHNHNHGHSPSTSTTSPASHTGSNSNSSNTKSSIYALATDPFGHIIASGSPERVIRLWDPRTGKRTGKLVGHTDNIRAILVSEDCRYLLTGSADASIKLWSLVTQRCLHTFTHHVDSVWSLHSTHPSLQVFYSGDKSGLVCKVDVEGCATVSEGECVLLCDERAGGTRSDAVAVAGGAGINKIVSADDRFVWTASGVSSINRWRVPPSRASRAGTYTREDTISIDSASPPPLAHSATHPTTAATVTLTDYHSHSISVPVPAGPARHSVSFEGAGSDHDHDHDIKEKDHAAIPSDSLIRLTSPNDPFMYSMGRGSGGGLHGSKGGFGRGMEGGPDAEVATLYSAASFLSIPRALTIAGIGPLNRTVFQATSQRPPAARVQQLPSGSPPHLSPPAHHHHLSPNNHHYYQQHHASPGLDSRSIHSQQLFTSHSLASLQPPPSQYIPQPPAELHDLSYDLHMQDMHTLASEATPLFKSPDYVIPGDVGLVRSLTLNDRVHVLTVDTVGEVAIWDIVRGICIGRFEKCVGGEEGPSDHSACAGKSPREVLELVREKIEGQSVTPRWASVDTKGGVLVVHLNERCFEAEVYADEVGYVNEKGGNDEPKINLGKWVLRNLFIGFVKEEQRIRKDQLSGSATPSPTESSFTSSPQKKRAAPSPEVLRRLPKILTFPHPTFSSTAVVCAPNMIPALPPPAPFSSDARPPISLTTPLIPIRPQIDDMATPVLESTAIPRSPSRPKLADGGGGGGSATTPYGRPQGNTGLPPLSNTNAPASPPAEYFTPKSAKAPVSLHKSMGSNVSVDDFSGWTGPGIKNGGSGAPTNVSTATEAMRPITPTTGLIGRLRSFGGKISATRRPPSESIPIANLATAAGAATATTGSLPSGTILGTQPTSATGSMTRKVSVEVHQNDPEKAANQQILSGTITPPQSTEAPSVAFPPDTLIIISEEPSLHHLSAYRGAVGNTHRDVRALEENMPTWLLAYLLQNKIPSVPQPPKISFVLLPWAAKDSEEEVLPELLNTSQSKLTASKYLRVRKLVNHVQEKLDKMTEPPGLPSSLPSSPTSSTSDETSSKAKPRAEDVYEILCNEAILPLDVTLAAVRQYVWKNSAELMLHYRLKRIRGNV